MGFLTLSSVISHFHLENTDRLIRNGNGFTDTFLQAYISDIVILSNHQRGIVSKHVIFQFVMRRT